MMVVQEARPAMWCPICRSSNVSEIDYLISSHYDEDHVSGLIGCLNAFQVDKCDWSRLYP